MNLIGVVVTLIIVGLLLYLVNNYLPMDEKVKGILNVVVIVVIIIWLLLVLVPLIPMPVFPRATH
jgi:Mn2+/Fe2+ NRAMP family transporter